MCVSLPGSAAAGLRFTLSFWQLSHTRSAVTVTVTARATANCQSLIASSCLLAELTAPPLYSTLLTIISSSSQPPGFFHFPTPFRTSYPFIPCKVTATLSTASLKGTASPAIAHLASGQSILDISVSLCPPSSSTVQASITLCRPGLSRHSKVLGSHLLFPIQLGLPHAHVSASHLGFFAFLIRLLSLSCFFQVLHKPTRSLQISLSTPGATDITLSSNGYSERTLAHFLSSAKSSLQTLISSSLAVATNAAI